VRREPFDRRGIAAQVSLLRAQLPPSTMFLPMRRSGAKSKTIAAKKCCVTWSCPPAIFIAHTAPTL
jgi:hypothetical protein